MADTSKLAGTSTAAQDKLDSIKNEDIIVETSETLIEKEEETEDKEETEEEEETESDDEPSKDDEIDEAELKEAKNLYKLLKDPATSKGVLEILAKKAGILDEPSTSKKETTEKVESIQEILREALGKEMAWMADKLAPAIEKIVGKSESAVSERLQAQQQEKITEQTNAAIERLAKETKGDSKKLETQMSALANQYLPGKDTKPYDYLRGLYNMATAARTVNKTKANVADKINRNAANVADRLTPNAGTDVTPKPGKKGLSSAIDQAMAELGQKRK